MKYFYEIHVFFSRTDGYSIPVTTDHAMDEDNLINLARKNNLFTDDGDANHVDYVDEIDEDTYFELGGKRESASEGLRKSMEQLREEIHDAIVNIVFRQDNRHLDINDNRGSLVIGGDDQEPVVILSIEFLNFRIVANYGVHDPEGHDDIDEYSIERLINILEACEEAVK